MARTRVSASRKAARGTQRGDRQRAPAQSDRLTALPAAPATLSAAARSAWDRFGAMAIDVGAVTINDMALLELLARTWADCEGFEQLLAVDGLIVQSGAVRKAHPAIGALAQSRALAHRLLGDLGLTPPSRERITVPPAADPGSKYLS